MEPNFVRWHLRTMPFDTPGGKFEGEIRVLHEETVCFGSKSVVFCTELNRNILTNLEVYRKPVFQATWILSSALKPDD